MPEDNRKENTNKIKKILIGVFVGLLLFSFVLNIVLLYKVYSLDSKLSELYSNATILILDGGFFS